MGKRAGEELGRSIIFLLRGGHRGCRSLPVLQPQSSRSSPARPPAFRAIGLLILGAAEADRSNKGVSPGAQRPYVTVGNCAAQAACLTRGWAIYISTCDAAHPVFLPLQGQAWHPASEGVWWKDNLQSRGNP